MSPSCKPGSPVTPEGAPRCRADFVPSQSMKPTTGRAAEPAAQNDRVRPASGGREAAPERQRTASLIASDYPLCSGPGLHCVVHPFAPRGWSPDPWPSLPNQHNQQLSHRFGAQGTISFLPLPARENCSIEKLTGKQARFSPPVKRGFKSPKPTTYNRAHRKAVAPTRSGWATSSHLDFPPQSGTRCLTTTIKTC